jgi:hypothetical protein
LTFLNRWLEHKRLSTERQKTFSKSDVLLVSSWMKFWLVPVVPKVLYFAFSKDSETILIMNCSCILVTRHGNMREYYVLESDILYSLFKSKIMILWDMEI